MPLHRGFTENPHEHPLATAGVRGNGRPPVLAPVEVHVTELETLAAKVEASGIGYTRMEMCVMELVRSINALVEQNAALIQACAEQDREENEDPIGYLSLKTRKR